MNYPTPNKLTLTECPDYIAVPEYKFVYCKSTVSEAQLENFAKNILSTYESLHSLGNAILNSGPRIQNFSQHQQGRAIDFNLKDEMQADINAFKIYMGLGYSPKTAYEVWLSESKRGTVSLIPKVKLNWKSRMKLKWYKFLNFINDIKFWLM